MISGVFKFSFLIFLAAAFGFAAAPARAACTSPAGTAGTIIYNSDLSVMQYCDDTNWVAFPKSSTPATSSTDPCRPAASPTGGTVCADGTIYAGLSPVGSTPMFTTRCDAGQVWNGTSCTGTQRTFCYNNCAPAPNITIGAGANSFNDGLNNTNTLGVLSNADSPYQAGSYCYNLVASNHSDWYLPAVNEGVVIAASYAAIGNFTTSGGSAQTSYHSSSESSQDRNMYFAPVSGGNDTQSKTSVRKIRCVRRGYVTNHCEAPYGLAGALTFNFDARVLQWCDGTKWHAAGPILSRPSGLVAHWPMDISSGGTAREVVNGTNDAVNGTAALAVGKVGGAVNFPTSSSITITAPTINTATTPFTIATWVYINTTKGTNRSYYILSRSGMSLQIGSFSIAGSQFINYNTALSSTALSSTTWHHIAVVSDGVNITFYLNGVADGTTTLPAPAGTVYNLIANANGTTNTTNGINGRLDDLRIYNVALTANEIKDLAMAECQSPTSGPGGLVYNNDNDVLQYCNGKGWVGIQKGVAPDNRSCKDILISGNSVGNGVYTIDPDGSGGNAPFSAYCDMTTDGGGWTMVAAQYEADPVTDWNEGIQGDYDPDLSTTKGFALSTAQLPPHTQTGFGRDLNPTYVDYIPLVYTTGNIPYTQLTSPRSGLNYEFFRNTAIHSPNHDPGQGQSQNNDHNNALEFDRVGSLSHSWSFAPGAALVTSRGFGMLGFRSGSDTYAWTVWVR